MENSQECPLQIGKKNAGGVKHVKDVPQQTVASVVTALTNRSLVVKGN